MAYPHHRPRRPLACSRAKERVPLLHAADRQAQQHLQRRLQHRRDARLERHHVTRRQGRRHPRRPHPHARLGLLGRRTLAGARRG